ncbi:MAG: response regulator, partial [Herminiimonas sp.]|nr:response regulator [Herminiimonas sp.]
EFESQAKSQLLAKVSHELRTPLSGIMASAELLSSETSDPQTTMRSGLILRLSSDLLLEINDLLDTAKLEAKALILESAPFDLRVVMEQIRLTFVSMAAAKHIGFHVTIDPAISQMVSGDAHYLARVLKNLVGNALKFTSTGEVEVALTLISKENHAYRILFSVRDTGIGIPAVLHKQIFEPFFQASAGTSRQYGGTGLGMSLAQDIVNLMGSDIVVESVPGTGSRFRFEVNLPVAALPCAESTPAAQVRVIKGKRVLVADDNATNLNLIRELLVLDEHDVAMAANGQEALDLLASTMFDIVFLDYHMGDMDGGQVLQVYQFGCLERAPVFFLTADTTAATLTKLMDIGAAGVLNKPVTRDALRRAVAQVCGTEPATRPRVASGADSSLNIAPEPPAGVVLDNAAAAAASAPPLPDFAPSLLKSVAPQYLDYAVIDELKALSPRTEFLSEIVSSATLDIERNCAHLLTALCAEDMGEVHDTAHALNGVCISVGATRLAALAHRLMRMERWEMLSAKAEWEHDVASARDSTLNALEQVLRGTAVMP